jgi:hypothetical protein
LEILVKRWFTKLLLSDLSKPFLDPFLPKFGNDFLDGPGHHAQHFQTIRGDKKVETRCEKFSEEKLFRTARHGG